MQTARAGRLIRKQFLVSEHQIAKLDRLASDRGTSMAEVVRLAIDAYEPGDVEKLNVPELMDLVSSRLQEAIRSTRRARRRVEQALKDSAGGAG